MLVLFFPLIWMQSKQCEDGGEDMEVNKWKRCTSTGGKLDEQA